MLDPTAPEEDELDSYYVYDKHKLTGPGFKTLWDEHKGAVPGNTMSEIPFN